MFELTSVFSDCHMYQSLGFESADHHTPVSIFNFQCFDVPQCKYSPSTYLLFVVFIYCHFRIHGIKCFKVHISRLQVLIKETQDQISLQLY